MPDGQSASLEQELGDLLDQERFEPPEEFVAQALITDQSEHEAAAEDPDGLVGRAGRGACTGSRSRTRSLDDADPPFYKWFEGGKINASYNCLDRHVEDGLGDRVAFHWRGEEGEERDVTYAELLADVQRFANALKDRGIERRRRRRDLPADDPRGRRRDARLRAHRRAAQRRLRRLQRRVGQGAHGVLRGQGADHRRRRAAQGQDRADQGRRSTRSWATLGRSRRSSSSGTPRPTARCRTGATSGTTRPGGGRRRVRGRAELDAEHPLFILYSSGSTAKPKGILHTHRRLPDAASRGRTSTSSTSRPTRTSTGARPTSAGSPGTPTSSTGRCSTARRGDVRGRAGLPRQGHLVGAVRALRRDASSTPRRPRSARA